MRPGAVVSAEFGVRRVTAEVLLRLNAYAATMRWGARWPQEILEARLSTDATHILLPGIRNGQRADEPLSVRCYAWLRDSSRQARVMTMLDVSEEDVRELPRLDQVELEALVVMLMVSLPLVEIDSWPFRMPEEQH